MQFGANVGTGGSNMTQEGSASLQYKYDGENRMTEFNNGAASYTYVGALRVKKVSGSTTTVYVFSGAKVIAEYANSTLSKEYIYGGASLLATYEGATLKYHQPDHLSMRMTTDSAGTILAQQGHYPFGEQWYAGAGSSKWQFTSYERDSESGLDYAMFRYDSTRIGRFVSPDLLAGDGSDPQSLNRYAYVANNPTNATDPLGLCYIDGLEAGAYLCGYMLRTIDGLGAAARCPYADCWHLKLQDIGNGQSAFFGWVPGASVSFEGTVCWTATANSPADCDTGHHEYQRIGHWEQVGTVSSDGPQVGFWDSIRRGLLETPWTLNFIVPLKPVPGVAGFGPALGMAYIPSSRTFCVSPGLGGSFMKNVSFGPLTHGSGSFPANARSILEGPSLSGGYNWPNRVGVQFTGSQSGAAIGPSIGVPGIGLAATVGYCADLTF